MSSIPEHARWRVSTGTARGAAHAELHLPNEDNVGYQAAGPAGGVVAAVADGHGARRHFRSLAGSLLAVRAGCAVVTELAAGLVPEAAGEWTAAQAEALRDQLPAAVVTRWRELVARHQAGHPYAPAEQAALDAAGDAPDIPYGSTLLVALIAGGWLVCGQIGDGDMLAVRPDGTAWTPVGGDDRLDGFHTTSLCQRGAVSSFRVAAHHLRSEPLLALLLGTDGYGNAQAADPWQPGRGPGASRAGGRARARLVHRAGPAVGRAVRVRPGQPGRHDDRTAAPVRQRPAGTSRRPAWNQASLAVAARLTPPGCAYGTTMTGQRALRASQPGTDPVR